MPMQRKLYSPDWPAIARRVKEATDWTCQRCGKPCRRPGEPLDTHRNTLTVAHLDHNPGNNDPANLAALCAPCHLHNDQAQHRRSAALTRRRRRRAAGQLEIEL